MYLVSKLALAFYVAAGLSSLLQAQPADSTNSSKLPIDANFLLNYYDQDGNHSAVTGGIGTEELSDYEMLYVINVPLDTTSNLGITAGVNLYTSASTDNIDFEMSSASKEGFRGQFKLDYSKTKGQLEFGFTAEASIETDYVSNGIGARFTTANFSETRLFSIAVMGYFDQILPIFPEETRGVTQPYVETNKRRTFSINGTYNHALTERLQMAVSVETVYQFGLLSTPFHRVYFQSDSLPLPFSIPSIERLPNERFKIPLGLRLSYFAAGGFIVRTHYRFYSDSWGINAHSANLETPIKINPYFTIYPRYRYHAQSAARYFGPFRSFQDGTEFYTSDFDLSKFNSHTYGFGLKYAPLYGLSRFKFLGNIAQLKSVELRYSHYDRSDGLWANMVSADLSFTFR